VGWTKRRQAPPHRVARFFGKTYQKWEGIIPNDQKIYAVAVKYKYQMTVKYLKRPFFYIGPVKIYPNWDFLYANLPSGNPASTFQAKLFRSFLFMRYLHETWFSCRIVRPILTVSYEMVRHKNCVSCKYVDSGSGRYFSYQNCLVLYVPNKVRISCMQGVLYIR
jgi:hypothetical protein